MNPRFLNFIRRVLLVWGGASLVAVVGFAAFILVSAGHCDRDDVATDKEVRFVLNRGALGNGRFERVMHSHVSGRSGPGGDHLDAYAIRISHVDVEELLPKAADAAQRWYRGDQLPPVLKDAVGMIAGSQHEVPWFPSVPEIESSAFYVSSWEVRYLGVVPSAVTLTLVRPSDRMVFYFEEKN